MTRKHLILMALGCLLPITALAAIFLLEIQISTVLLFALFLLCPALHLFLMRDHNNHAPSHHKRESVR
jgi:hypothetical protein